MGKVTILKETPKNPISLIGEMIGICYGSDTTEQNKNYKRGLSSIKAGHGRCLEYATIWFTLEGYSSRTIRQFYTHIGGAPTRTQASTRYINYKNFDYIVPLSIEKNNNAKNSYYNCMKTINECYEYLINNCNISKEDAANILPLGITTVVSCHFNARTLSDMSHQRLCNRTYWEYKELMRDIISAIKNYSEEWKILSNEIFYCKCDDVGFCKEEYSCGKYKKKEG